MRSIECSNRRRYSLAAKTIALLLASLAAPSLTRAETDEDLMDYDSIVRELSQAGSKSVAKTARAEPRDPFDDVMLHGGIGMAMMTARIGGPDGRRLSLHQQGFQAALGIDLFSPHWLAEGTARSFGGRDYGRTTVSLKEFDLKIYYRDRISQGLGFRAGVGLTARYMNVAALGFAPQESTTPSTIAALGLDWELSRSVSVGAELSSRNTLIDETIDRNAIDAVLRFDTHF